MMRRVLPLMLGAILACSKETVKPNPLANSADPAYHLTAPAEFKARFETSRGGFTVHVKRDWAPIGADRFYSLVKGGFYDEVRFFRVIAGFCMQFGIHGDPKVSAAWQNVNLKDDPVKQEIRNDEGTICFAKTDAPNSRTTQVFINLADNRGLDKTGFAPFGRVIEGMKVVYSLYAGYGNIEQGRIEREGNAFLNHHYPKLDYIKTARLVE